MSLWYRHLSLDLGESVTWKETARWADPSHGIPGRLYLTRTRLLFEPTRLHAKGWRWSTMLHLIASVSIEESEIFPRPGGEPLRLRLDLVDTRSECFEVAHVQRALEVIRVAIPGGGGGTP